PTAAAGSQGGVPCFGIIQSNCLAVNWSLFGEVGCIVIRSLFRVSAVALFVLTCVSTAAASEAELGLPDLSTETFLGLNGRVLLMIGLVISLAGGVFGIMTFIKL